MKYKIILIFLLITSNSFSQANHNKRFVVSIIPIQPLNYQTEQMKLQVKCNVYLRFIPDTVISKARVLKIKKQKYGFLIDIMDVDNSNYYKIVSWCNSCNKKNRIMINQVYIFEIWEGAPRQLGDFVFFAKWVEQDEKKIKLNYQVKRRRILTYYFTNSLNGISYINDQ